MTASARPRLGPFSFPYRGIACPPLLRFNGACPEDPYIREKSPGSARPARRQAAEYFSRFPKERYRTEVESWRELQSIEFTMKRLREPISGGERGTD
jgi:hypothetical protein